MTAAQAYAQARFDLHCARLVGSMLDEHGESYAEQLLASARKWRSIARAARGVR